MSKERFIEALENNSISEIRSIPKSDLHNHAGRGGNLSYIENMLNVKIDRLTKPLISLDEMQEWLNDNVKVHFPDKNGFIHRVAAAFVQARADNIAVLAMSYSIADITYFGSLDIFIVVMDGLHKVFAPETKFMPDLFLSCPSSLSQLDEIFNANWFKGIDLVNYSNAMSMDDMKAICRKARGHGLITKAHVGEFGSADDVMRYAEELELNQIQHGIAATSSPQIMNWLVKNKVQLNVCPTSNVLLGNTKSYETHQIRILFDYGVSVTINTDDLLIFDSTVSGEYLKLYNAGLMTAEELNIIREVGLSKG